MAKIKDENFVQIQGWMLNRLNLKGNDLIVYAVIYGFTQDGENWFEGSRQYLADWCKCSLAGVQKNLKSLTEKGLIIKEDVVINKVRFCKYKANLDCLQVDNKVYGGSKQSLLGQTTEFTGGSKQSLHNNNRLNNNNKNNKDNNSIKQSNKFVPPTLEEIQTYCIERNNNVNPKTFFDYYEAGNWTDAKGNKIKNWKQKLITWEKHQKPKQDKGSGWDYINVELEKVMPF